MYHLIEQLDQQHETLLQQQQPQIPMEQETNTLNYFKPSSQRLPSGLQETTAEYCENGKSKLSQCNEEQSNQMQQHHLAETILYSMFESNGQYKYLIR